MVLGAVHYFCNSFVYREHRTKDVMVLHLILNVLDDTIFLKISLARFSKTTSDILENTYQGEDSEIANFEKRF